MCAYSRLIPLRLSKQKYGYVFIRRVHSHCKIFNYIIIPMRWNERWALPSSSDLIKFVTDCLSGFGQTEDDDEEEKEEE